ARAVPPARAISLATERALSSRMSATTTEAPPAESACASARPIPLPPPVTSAALPWISVIGAALQVAIELLVHVGDPLFVGAREPGRFVAAGVQTALLALDVAEVLARNERPGCLVLLVEHAGEPGAFRPLVIRFQGHCPELEQTALGVELVGS